MALIFIRGKLNAYNISWPFIDQPMAACYNKIYLEVICMEKSNDNIITLYHASTISVEKPIWNYGPSKEKRDFGMSFYMSKIRYGKPRACREKKTTASGYRYVYR